MRTMIVFLVFWLLLIMAINSAAWTSILIVLVGFLIVWGLSADLDSID